MVSYARLTAMPEPSDCAILAVLLECATYIRGHNQPGAFGLSPSVNITEDDKSSWVTLTILDEKSGLVDPDHTDAQVMISTSVSKLPTSGCTPSRQGNRACQRHHPAS